MIRIASWPHWYEPNPYLNAFYDGLASHGIEHLRHVPLDPAGLERAGADALHLHWAYPFWRDPPRRTRLLRARAFRRLLQTLAARGVPIVWTVHNLVHHEGDTRADRRGRAALRRYADLRVFTSAWARDAFHDGAGEPRSSRRRARPGRPSRHRQAAEVVSPMGGFARWLPPPPAREAARAACGIAPDDRVLLCFGQIRAYKGIDIAVAALDALPGTRLIVAGRRAGRGPPARPSAPADRVTRIERVLSQSELVNLIAASDAVLLPYRRVTGSAALLTALSLGRGVVTTDLPYFREVLAGSPAGVLARTPTPAGLAEAVERFFAGGREMREEAARRRVGGLDWAELTRPVADWLLDRATTLPGTRARLSGSDPPTA